MKKNLMDKMINSHDKYKQSQSGTWLYASNEVAGYVTADDEFLNLRPEVDNDDR